MRVAHVMLSRHWGGAERLVLDQIRLAARAGVKQLVVLRRAFRRAGDLGDSPGVEVARIPALNDADLLSLLPLRRAVAAFAPDLLHVTLVRGTWMGSRVGGGLGIPVLCSLHNPMKEKYARRVDFFTVHTGAAAGRVASWGVSRDRIRMIPNLSTFPPARESGSPPELPPTFVALGRFVHKKGFDLLIRALARVRERIPEARLRLAGSGELQGELEALAGRLGLGAATEGEGDPGRAAVEFVPWVDDVPGFLRTGDVFVLPSREEPFGIVVLEAMAAGRPVVATRTEGPVEVVTPETGWLCETDSVEDLAGAMLASVSDPRETARRARAGLERYRSHYHADVILPRHLAWWSEIIERHPASA